MRFDTPETTNLGAAPALLQLMWLASPALPVGGFSYSEGLEAAVEWAGVADAKTAGDWLVDQLHLSIARSDLAVVAQAIPARRSSDRMRLIKLNEWVLQTRETSELRQQTRQMGRSMVDWFTALHPKLAFGAAADQIAEPSYPMAFALAATYSRASVRDALVCYAFGWAENMVQAAVKSVPLGQNAGQRILQRLVSQIPSAVDKAMSLDDQARQSFCPMLAILSAQHETQYSRLFRS